MKNNIFLIIIFLYSFCSCQKSNDLLKEIEIKASNGETIFIYTLNEGLSGDYQYTKISRERLTHFSKDDAIKGLDPFIYTFSNDTLKLYSRNSIRYKVPFATNKLKIEYFSVTNSDYVKMYKKTFSNQYYHSVPNHIETSKTPTFAPPPRENK